MEISLIYAALFVVTILWCAMMLRWFVEANYPNVAIKKIDQWSKPVVLGPAGVSSIQGRRPHMEDTYQAAVNLGTENKPAAFFGVYDGHGGSKAAVFTADHLHQLIAQKDFYNNPHEAIRSAFLTLDAQWLQQAHHNLWDDGTTAITALIVKNTLYVNNVGDSRCVLGFKGLAIEMSSDHKPDRDDEKDRIEALGGRIICYGTWRVEGMLAVTRAIGDRRLKKYVSAEPEIRERTLKEGDDFLILASDGVWDVLTNQEAVDITYRAKDVKVASEMLTDIAYKRGSMDNATAMVVDLSGYRS